MTIDEIIENFDVLDDWEDRYRYMIELGRELAPLTPEEHNDETKVRGCASQVWLVIAEEGQGPDMRFHIRGDSDAHLVRGLIAVLLSLYSGQKPADILKIDEKAVFARLGLFEHLTPQRSNGFASMIARIKSACAQSATIERR